MLYTRVSELEESISKRFSEEWCEWNGVTFVFWWRPGSLQSFYFHHLAEGKQEGDDCQDHSEICCHPHNILDRTECWRLRRAHAPGRITEINYWLEVFTCLIAPNCWAILPLKLPDWVVTLSWVYSVRTGIFSIRKLVFDWCFINFMGFTIINPVFTTFLRQFGFYIFLSALKYDDQMKSTKKYEL